MLLPNAVVDRLALKLADMQNLRQRDTPMDRRWLNAIEHVLSRLPKDMERLIIAHYVEGKTGVEVMYELCIERTTFYSWRDQILSQLALSAVEAGLMQVYYD